MPMLRRSISEVARLVPIWFSPGIPVRKIVTRSFRGGWRRIDLEERLQQLRHLGIGHEIERRAIAGRLNPLNASLRPEDRRLR